MTYGCGAQGCITCYPLQYGCEYCSERWEEPIKNGDVFTCPECDYVNNSKGDL